MEMGKLPERPQLRNIPSKGIEPNFWALAAEPDFYDNL